MSEAEFDKLRAEIERLKMEIRDEQARSDEVNALQDANREHLLAKIERLTAALAAERRIQDHQTEVNADALDAKDAEIERLRRGEFICTKCGVRKDGEGPKGDF